MAVLIPQSSATLAEAPGKTNNIVYLLINKPTATRKIKTSRSSFQSFQVLVFMFVVRTWHAARRHLPTALHTVPLILRALQIVCKVATRELAPLLEFNEDSLDANASPGSQPPADALNFNSTASLFVWQATSEQYNEIVRHLEIGTVSGRKLFAWLRGVASGELPLLLLEFTPASHTRFFRDLSGIFGTQPPLPKQRGKKHLKQRGSNSSSGMGTDLFSEERTGSFRSAPQTASDASGWGELDFQSSVHPSKSSNASMGTKIGMWNDYHYPGMT